MIETEHWKAYAISTAATQSEAEPHEHDGRIQQECKQASGCLYDHRVLTSGRLRELGGSLIGAGASFQVFVPVALPVTLQLVQRH